MKTMAHLDNNIVVNITVHEDDEPETPNLITYTENNQAYIGGDYFENFFYPPKPYASWLRNGKGSWMPPIPYPESNEDFYYWDESVQNWSILTQEQLAEFTADPTSFDYYFVPSLSAIDLPVNQV